jgi:hypothetical protein
MSMRRRMGREGEMVGEEEEKSSLVAVQEGKEDSMREREREREREKRRKREEPYPSAIEELLRIQKKIAGMSRASARAACVLHFAAATGLA